MKVSITAYGFPDGEFERSLFEKAGIEVVVAQCRTKQDVTAAAEGCQGLANSPDYGVGEVASHSSIPHAAGS